LARLVGITLASEIAMADRKLSAEEAVRYGVANRMSKSNESVVDEAVQIASKISDLSPDAIIITRSGLREVRTQSMTVGIAPSDKL
jgi:enoyl-CoA hydratase/carnithine racemase